MENDKKERFKEALPSVKEIERWIEQKENDAHLILYHSADASVNDSICHGIFPDFGEWVEEVLAGAADEDLVDEIKEDDHNHVCYFSKDPDWVSMKASRAHPDKSLHDMTIDDVIKHGQLCIIGVEIDKEDDELKVAGSKEDNYVEKSHYLFSGEEADLELPFGVERGDIYSHNYMLPDFSLTGETLVLFLARNYPKANIMEEPLETIIEQIPELSKEPQMDLFKNNVQNFIDEKQGEDIQLKEEPSKNRNTYQKKP